MFASALFFVSLHQSEPSALCGRVSEFPCGIIRMNICMYHSFSSSSVACGCLQQVTECADRNQQSVATQYS